MLPFVRPDLIKLDMRLLQGRTTTEAARIVNAVRAQAERTDAVVVAEGIETMPPWSPGTSATTGRRSGAATTWP